MKNYWPYEEVKAIGDCSSGHFVLSTPWLNVEVDVDPSDVSRVGSVLKKLSEETLSPNELGDINWLFSPLARHPLTYTLPRIGLNIDGDPHDLLDKTLLQLSPNEMLLRFSKQCIGSTQEAFERLANNSFESPQWKWDVDVALSFSIVPGGHDPMTLFSIARRFHLLESVENNKTGELFQLLHQIRSDRLRFQEAIAQVVRQNHYVTQKCDSALRPSLQIAQNAKTQVHHFIRAEAGHDILLARALKAMGITQPDTIRVIDPILVLMEVFRIVAQRNFLAFSMVVDMFERSSCENQDPLASLLSENGYLDAAKQIDLHREINDQGSHEDVGAKFLENMSAVDPEYGKEALRLAELVTHLLHQVSSTLIDGFKM